MTCNCGKCRSDEVAYQLWMDKLQRERIDEVVSGDVNKRETLQLKAVRIDDDFDLGERQCNADGDECEACQ